MNSVKDFMLGLGKAVIVVSGALFAIICVVLIAT